MISFRKGAAASSAAAAAGATVAAAGGKYSRRMIFLSNMAASTHTYFLQSFCMTPSATQVATVVAVSVGDIRY